MPTKSMSLKSGPLVPIGPSGPRSKLIFLDDKVYEGLMGF